MSPPAANASPSPPPVHPEWARLARLAMRIVFYTQAAATACGLLAILCYEAAAPVSNAFWFDWILRFFGSERLLRFADLLEHLVGGIGALTCIVVLAPLLNALIGVASRQFDVWLLILQSLLIVPFVWLVLIPGLS